MLYHAAQAGSFSLLDGVRESLTSFHRAGKHLSLFIVRLGQSTNSLQRNTFHQGFFSYLTLSAQISLQLASSQVGRHIRWARIAHLLCHPVSSAMARIRPTFWPQCIAVYRPNECCLFSQIYTNYLDSTVIQLICQPFNMFLALQCCSNLYET